MSHRPGKILLSVLWLWASLPAWSFQSAGGHGRSLTCVHACALSGARLTQGGRLASMGDGSCGVRAHSQSQALQAQRADAVQPAPGLPSALAEAPAVAAPYLADASPAPRGPPLPRLYLWSQHPSAQAPPTFL